VILTLDFLPYRLSFVLGSLRLLNFRDFLKTLSLLHVDASRIFDQVEVIFVEGGESVLLTLLAFLLALIILLRSRLLLTLLLIDGIVLHDEAVELKI
jgi:hypothetical protein